MQNSSHSKRYLIAELTGGLGNQLFGLAACLGLSERIGLDAAYSLVNYGLDNPRKFEIGKIVESFDMKLVNDYEYVFKESKF